MNVRSAHLASPRRCWSHIAGLAALAIACAAPSVRAQTAAAPAASPAAPMRAFPSSPGFLPIGVWLQNPRHAPYFRTLGINTFVALRKGPTEAQLAEIARHGMHAVTEQNDLAFASPNAHVIAAFMLADEPDNAPRIAPGVHGDCVMPDEIRRRYEALKARDPTRPVFLNFGQGVANRGWVGRGTKCAGLDHETYYREAARGADILSFDIYPATEARQPDIYGRLELVGEGVANLKRWADKGQSVWAVIGTAHINDPNRRPTVEEIRAQVWMALINGARGIVYFLHEWQPSFREDAIFRYPEIAAGIGRINAEIASLAPVLDSAAPDLKTTMESRPAARLAVLARRVDGVVYVLAVSLSPHPAQVRLRLDGAGDLRGVAIGEDRVLDAPGGAIADDFAPYGVHLYKLQPLRK